MRDKISKEQLTRDFQMDDSKVPEWLLKASERIIKHMNKDHSNSIVSTLNGQHGIKDKNSKMYDYKLMGTLLCQIKNYIF